MNTLLDKMKRFKGGGGGNQPEFFVKLVSEIAVDQQTKTIDQTFEEVPDPNRPPVPVVQPRLYLVTFWPNYAKSPERIQFQNCSLWSPELVYEVASILGQNLSKLVRMPKYGHIFFAS